MQNAMVRFNFSVFDRKYPFFGKFYPKHQNCQLGLKFGTYNSVQNIWKKKQKKIEKSSKIGQDNKKIYTFACFLSAIVKV